MDGATEYYYTCFCSIFWLHPHKRKDWVVLDSYERKQQASCSNWFVDVDDGVLNRQEEKNVVDLPKIPKKASLDLGDPF